MQQQPAPDADPKPVLTRRRLLQIGAAGAVATGGGFAGIQLLGGPTAIGPHSAAVAATEAARVRTGSVVRRELRAAPSTIDLGGRAVRTWAYNNMVPGPEFRVTAGDELRVTLANELPEPTTVHWHGLALRNDMDGVPDLTMGSVAPSAAFDYSFVVPDPGTYWFHPHVGVQLDTGLAAPLIVEDPREVGDYDDEVVLVLDDWTDGVGDSPGTILERMRADGMADMSGMDDMAGAADMATPAEPLGPDTGDVAYPLHLVNGRAAQDPAVITCKPRRRIRFRVINAGSDTAYRFAIGGHRLRVTHADGFPVRPVEVDTLILGMGERYDVVAEVQGGVFPIVAVPEGKDDPAGLAILRSESGRAPTAGGRPAELDGRMLTYGDLSPTDAVALPPREPDRVLDLALQMADGGRQWLLNGQPYGDHEPLEIESDERVRVRMRNESVMFHPMHMHGHTFALAGGGGPGIRKDTVNVTPMQTLEVDLQADNPGQWLVHCHNAYHGELGMMTVLSYVQ